MLLILINPVQALAWGPGVHLALGNYLLSHIKLLTLPCYQVISLHWQSFLYGCLSADMLIGKGKNLTPRHCHSWQSGFNLLKSVNDPHLLAYAYGYLAHLAADVIAHNFYVPNVLQLGKGRGKLSHVYIEMQADRKTQFSREQLKEIMNSPYKDADKSLALILQKSKFTFSFKKTIYRGSLALSRVSSYQSSLGFLGRKLKKYHSDEYLDDMLELSFQAILECLTKQYLSILVDYDPMGFKNLELIKNSKKKDFCFLSRGKATNNLFFLPSMNLLTLVA